MSVVFLLGQWDYHADSRLDLWLEIRFYSMITIFVSSRVTDAVFTKQKRMQAMIVTNHPDKVIEKSIKNCTAEQP